MRTARLVLIGAILAVAPMLQPRVEAQALRSDVFNLRRVLSGRIWGSGQWMAFCADEDSKDLNGDGDAEDTLLYLVDTRSVKVVETGIAVDPALVDDEEDWPVALDGNTVVVQWSEFDNGKKDQNGNGKAEEDVLVSFNPVTRQITPLGITGTRPEVVGGKIYCLQQEEDANKDLNGDGDKRDGVLVSIDPASKVVESLGMECADRYSVNGDWIAAAVNEAMQGGKDLNGDGDVSDVVAHVYQISQKKWTNSGFECSFDLVLTSKLMAVGVTEGRQGNKDLNGDSDPGDVVCHVWDLANARGFNTARDCSVDLSADGTVVGFICSEANQGKTDLNGNKQATDEVAFAYVLGSSAAVNIGRDATGGLVAVGGKVAFGCSEALQGNRDLNQDKDTDDLVLLVYDPARHSVANLGYAVDGTMIANGSTLVFRVAEVDQGDRDLNRDGDADDTVLAIANITASTNSASLPGYAASEYVQAGDTWVGFSVTEIEQGDRDLNGDGDSDDEIVHLARLKGR